MSKVTISAGAVLLRVAKNLEYLSEQQKRRGESGYTQAFDAHAIRLLYDNLQNVYCDHNEGKSSDVLREFFDQWTGFDMPSGLKNAEVAI